MFNVMWYVGSLIILLLILLLAYNLNYKSNHDKEKNRTFECGFDPSGNTRLQFCIKFFLVGVIFLIFDVEVGLILPLPFRQPYIVLFIIVLVGGLTYEWYYGGLEWLVYVNGGYNRQDWFNFFWVLTHNMNNVGGELNILSSIINATMVCEKGKNTIFHCSKRRVPLSTGRRCDIRSNWFLQEMSYYWSLIEGQFVSSPFLGCATGNRIKQMDGLLLSDLTESGPCGVADNGDNKIPSVNNLDYKQNGGGHMWCREEKASTGYIFFRIVTHEVSYGLPHTHRFLVFPFIYNYYSPHFFYPS